jgi:predicted RNA-binding Zn-ribbon protein involved in translation (DUF1610 family)
MDNRSKQRLVDRIETAPADQVLSMICPACQGSLDIGCSRVGKAALHVSCATCGWKVISDGLSAPPPWVAVLGTKIRTKELARVDATSAKT